MKRIPLVLLAAVGFAAALQAEDPKIEIPQQSPLNTVRQVVGLTDIEVVYSRPGVKGRTVFGGLESYGKVWRTGANASTKIKFSTAVKLNGSAVPAGTYALYTIPGEREWTIILSRDTTLWGAYGYDAKNDLVRFPATPTKLTEPVETFTIDLNEIRTESATLELRWQNTRVAVKLECSAIAPAFAQIEAALAAAGEKSAGFYYNVLEFCLANDVGLPKASVWADQGIAQHPKAAWVIIEKAWILQKLGDKPGAIATARLAAAAAPGDQGLAQAAQQLIASLQ